MSHPGFPGVRNDPGSNQPHEQREHLREIARALNRINQGKLNCVLHLTLRANQATTVLEDARLSAFSYLGFDPLTANAAAELAAGTMYVLAANRRNGQHTVTHANAVSTDREYFVGVFG
jgi:hypothetical protein